jgi:hypothetical protein
MKQTWSYSFGFEPPSPVVDVDLFLPWKESSNVTTQSLQVDSGADMTGVPIKVLLDLGARPVNVLSVFDFNQRPADIPIFEISITIAGRNFEVVRVVGIRSRIGFVGRDVLQEFLVALDGRSGEASFTDDDLIA